MESNGTLFYVCPPQLEPGYFTTLEQFSNRKLYKAFKCSNNTQFTVPMFAYLNMCL